MRLFGVQLDIDSPMRKSFSMDSLHSSSRISTDDASDKISKGYLSDGPIGRTQQRKKGVPWTEEEHRTFLAGIEKLGKGDWRGISRNFVTTRTATQVASHAQKYFLRQNSFNKKKRRSSLFDMVGNSNRAVHATDLRPNDPLSSCVFPTPSSYTTCHDVHKSNPPIDLNSLEKELQRGNQESNHLQSPSVPHVIPLGPLYESSSGFDSQASSVKTKPVVALDPLNLELTIAAPRPLGKSRSPPSSLLIGPISVT